MDKRDGKLCLNGCFTFLPLHAFAPNLRSPDGLSARCRSCEADRASIRKHGVTVHQKSLLANAQGGCRICKTDDPGGHGWVVDHDHACCPGDESCASCRRGILCARCNTALGYARDSPDLLRAMADYLESGERITPPSQSTGQWTDWHKRVARTETTDKDVLTKSQLPTSDISPYVSRAGGRKPMTFLDLAAHLKTREATA